MIRLKIFVDVADIVTGVNTHWHSCKQDIQPKHSIYFGNISLSGSGQTTLPILEIALGYWNFIQN